MAKTRNQPGLSRLLLLSILLLLFHGARLVLSNETKYVQVVLNVTQTEPSVINVSAWKNGTRKLCILCYPGQDKAWHKLWINPKILVPPPDPATRLDFYYGPNSSEILKKSESSTFLSWSPFSLLKEEHTFDPFNNSCIGIASDKGYIVNFVVKNPEKWFVAYTVLGLLLFFLAAPLSRNTVLQYSTGVSVGVMGSLLLAVFILSKVLPQKMKTLTYIIAAISTSASMYLYQWFSYYLGDVVRNHWQILLGYIVVMGLVSFAIMYRYGPISNQRTLNLVKWTLQLVGLFLVYQGTQIAEVAVAIIVVAVVVHHFPPSLVSFLRKFRLRCFRPKIQLLTEEEYYEEGEVETKRALEELRRFCHSPDCDAWRTVSRLSSPSKFASFIEGSFHLSDMELEDHSALYISNMNDDSESEVDLYMTER